MQMLSFFGLCHYCAGKGREPGAYLTDCVKKRRWDLVRKEDETWGRRAIAAARPAGEERLLAAFEAAGRRSDG